MAAGDGATGRSVIVSPHGNACGPKKSYQGSQEETEIQHKTLKREKTGPLAKIHI